MFIRILTKNSFQKYNLYVCKITYEEIKFISNSKSNIINIILFNVIEWTYKSSLSNFFSTFTQPNFTNYIATVGRTSWLQKFLLCFLFKLLSEEDSVVVEPSAKSRLRVFESTYNRRLYWLTRRRLLHCWSMALVVLVISI